MLLQTPVGVVAVLSPDLLLFIAHSVQLITCSIENQSFNRFWSIWLILRKTVACERKRISSRCISPLENFSGGEKGRPEKLPCSRG